MAMTTKRPRKKLTPEQQAAYEEKHQKLRDLSRLIGGLTEGQRHAMAQQMGTVITADGRPLSPHNICMLVHQCADATIVGGFRQWKRLGRSVRKGEKASYIWAPRAPRGGSASEAGEESNDERRFMMVPVFDVSQTDVETEDNSATQEETL